jgi:DNA-binding PadR family transcriptional regulator
MSNVNHTRKAETSSNDSEPTSQLSPLVNLTSFQRDILAVLARYESGADYGLGIKTNLETYYGDVNHGRLYPNLDELVEMGFVKKSELDKRTNQYELTETGQTALKRDLEWRIRSGITEA